MGEIEWLVVMGLLVYIAFKLRAVQKQLDKR